MKYRASMALSVVAKRATPLYLKQLEFRSLTLPLSVVRVNFSSLSKLLRIEQKLERL
jgi:hypothetical protein